MSRKKCCVSEPPTVWPVSLIIDLSCHHSHVGYFFFFCWSATCQRNKHLHTEGAGSGQRDECETEVHLHLHSAGVSSVCGSVLELQALKFRTGWVGVYQLCVFSITCVFLFFWGAVGGFSVYCYPRWYGKSLAVQKLVVQFQMRLKSYLFNRAMILRCFTNQEQCCKIAWSRVVSSTFLLLFTENTAAFLN